MVIDQGACLWGLGSAVWEVKYGILFASRAIEVQCLHASQCPEPIRERGGS